ncbi:S-layer homology domain-containing protein [Demequina aurantiaca]|uniref:CAP and S-layer homology domain-containing protein n=1 Tax=Demequina aurantiaca TaxID=676200 RepID=UPI003D3263F6
MSFATRRSMRVGALVMVAAFVATLAAPSIASASSSSDQGSAAILKATNDLRTSKGRLPLVSDSGIDSVAQAWAASMLSKRVLAHNPNYSSSMPRTGLSSWGENVGYACGYGGVAANAAAVMKGLTASSGHYANMTYSSFTNVGIGFAYSSSSDCAYVVQDFGKYSGPFSDVTPNHQFAYEIEWLVDQSITTGYSDGSYKPKYSVTREAFAAFMYRLAGSPSYSAPKKSGFKDVPTNDQFYKEISWLSDQRITTGYSDGTFRPGDEISREAIAAFLYRASGSPSVSRLTSDPFKDVDKTDKFAKEIKWLSKSGVTTGYSNGTFAPYSDVSREATAAFLYRARSIVDF